MSDWSIKIKAFHLHSSSNWGVPSKVEELTLSDNFVCLLRCCLNLDHAELRIWQGYTAAWVSQHFADFASKHQPQDSNEPYCFKWLLCKLTPNSSLNISQHFEGFDTKQWAAWSEFSVLVIFSSSNLAKKVSNVEQDYYWLVRSGLASHIAILSKIEIYNNTLTIY